jgi:ribose 5-phosphate isomerase B
MSIKIVIAADHAGYDRKSEIIDHLIRKGNQVKDLGTYNNQSVDYPEYAKNLADFMLNNPQYLGVLICGSGIGMSIAVNRFKHIRAALCINTEMAELSKLHNNANVLILGARISSKDSSLELLEVFLKSKFLGGRHELRVKELAKL